MGRTRPAIPRDVAHHASPLPVAARIIGRSRSYVQKEGQLERVRVRFRVTRQ